MANSQARPRRTLPWGLWPVEGEFSEDAALRGTPESAQAGHPAGERQGSLAQPWAQHLQPVR